MTQGHTSEAAGWEGEGVRLWQGDVVDVLRGMADGSVQAVVTSPPYYGLRDYGVEGQIGLEGTPSEYVERLVGVFREVRRVLRDDGTVWLNLGDSYGGPAGNNQGGMSAIGGGQQTKNGAIFSGRLGAAGTRAKDLIGIPWRVAFALQADGWYLRQDIIWAKPNPMPESVRDRCTKAHEYIFLLSKSAKYYYDAEAVAELPVSSMRSREKFNGEGAVDTKKRGWGSYCGTYPTRNRRSVWTVATSPYSGAHFATFPPKLIEPCILAGCPEGGTVLDPFAGSGTVLMVAAKQGRIGWGIELNPEYVELARRRVLGDQMRLVG